MIRSVIVAIFLLSCSTVLIADDLILRATPKCCVEDTDDFPIGSKALLLIGEEVVASDEIEGEPSPFEFEDIEPGIYTLIIWVKGFYPAKFTGNDVGRSGVYDYELSVPLDKLGTPSVEGQMTVNFIKTLSNQEVFENLSQWEVGTYWSDRVIPEEVPRAYKLSKTSDYIQARVTYKNTVNLLELIFVILKDEDVVSCTPLFISSKK